jgi:hypothetical protein
MLLGHWLSMARNTLPQVRRPFFVDYSGIHFDPVVLIYAGLLSTIQQTVYSDQTHNPPWNITGHQPFVISMTLFFFVDWFNA